ncbi:MAG TPA: alpha/beta fold hydrolase [Gemmataceae bacterium]|nr:alpha/beta fold hydrolase [Gemmataceae bacterium]
MKSALWLIAGMTASMSGIALQAQEAYPISIPVPAGSAAPVYKRWQVLSRDDTKLVVHEWAPARVVAGKPAALFLHGIGMHGEPYRSIASAFTSRGIRFIVPDLRGHGRSDGTRGELAPPDVLRADIGAVFAFIHKRYPEAPVVLMGDSMGGVIATDYAWRGEQRLAGLALMVPAFGLNKTQWEKPAGDLKNLLTRHRIALGTEAKMKPSTQSMGFLKARLGDKLALQEVELSYLLRIHEMQREWSRAAATIKVPLFLCVAEKDQVIENAVVRRFFDRAATPKEDKTWRKLDGAYHTVCWDPATPALMDDLTQWILKHVK